MNPMREAREHIKGTLDLPGVTVYAYPHENPAIPCVEITASDPYAVPITLGRTAVNLLVTVMVTQDGTNKNAQQLVEDRAWAVVTQLRAAGVVVGDVSAPRQVTLGTAQVAAVEVVTTTHVNDEGD